MSMGTRRQRQRQEPLWITHTDLARAPGHPFYKRLNQLLDEGKFDEFAEKECAKFYAENNGRSEEHTSELQSRLHLVCRLLLEKKKKDDANATILILDNEDYDYSNAYFHIE